MYPFAYHRPRTLQDARSLFSGGEDATFVSGGHTLLPALKQHLAQPSDLIDLTALPEMQGIERRGEGVLIRGATTHSQVFSSPLVQEVIPVLARLAGSIADRHVRHRGTIGGSVANNDPAADYPAAVLGLSAVVHTDRREIPADEFFTGLYETARAPDEIVVAVEFPQPLSVGYAKFRSAASRYAVAAVLVARTPSEVRLAVTGAGALGVFRPLDWEGSLEQDFRPEALDGLAIDPADLLGDHSASAEYRASLVKTLAKRAVAGQGRVQVFT